MFPSQVLSLCFSKRTDRFFLFYFIFNVREGIGIIPIVRNGCISDVLRSLFMACGIQFTENIKTFTLTIATYLGHPNLCD